MLPLVIKPLHGKRGRQSQIILRPSVWPKYHSWSEVSDKQRSIWYCDDEEDVLVEEEPPKPKRDKPPSPPKIRRSEKTSAYTTEG